MGCVWEEAEIFDLGAGLAVPTIRLAGEDILDLCPNAFLIRINPNDTEVPLHLRDRAVSLPMTALTAIQHLKHGV